MATDVLLVEKKRFLVEATKKRKNFFSVNFDCLRKKTCTKTSRRAFFEYSLKTSLFPSLQNKGFFSSGKKGRCRERLYKAMATQKNQVVNFKVGVVEKTCGEIFGLVRFHGAGAGCGSRAGKILPAQRGLRL